jgi:hypothetical protein
LANCTRTWRTARESWASARDTASCASTSFRRTSGWPAFTKSVLSAAIIVTLPPTCGVTWMILPST